MVCRDNHSLKSRQWQTRKVLLFLSLNNGYDFGSWQMILGKKASEDAISSLADDEGSFEPEKMKGLIGTLFGAPKAEAPKAEAPEEHIKGSGHGCAHFDTRASERDNTWAATV